MREAKPPYNFGGLPEEFTDYKKAQVAVVPVPFDLTTSWMSGTHHGPKALIEASGYMELYDIETRSEVYRRGIFTDESVRAKNTNELNENVYQGVLKHISAKKFVVTLGGEHSISYGAAKAHIEHFPKLSILHLDAHTDRREEFEGDKFSHACPLGRISELTPDIIREGGVGEHFADPGIVPRRRRPHSPVLLHSMSWVE